MRIIKTVIFVAILANLSFGEGLSFRGKSTESLMQEPLPMAFQHFVETELDLSQNLNFNRGTFLIIVPDGLVGYLDAYVVFKKSQGFDVIVSLLSEAGSSANDIKGFIDATLTADPMLEYVLLIGDVDGFAALPSFYYGPANDVSDQKYTHLVGDDIIPDVFIGRMSVDNLTDLIVILSKTMQYAKDPLAYDQDWLNRGLVVAGNYSNTFPIPITPKWTSYWLRDELLDFGYAQVDTVFYPPTQQGASQIISVINQGVGIVNYRGWGDANGWHYPEFHVSDVNNLNNGWFTPVFFGFVCNSNDFANNVDPCFSEAILRAGTPSVPKGGVAFIGPSDLHTSTKYNNIINAYMYDSMLNHGVVELGPAMLAGQLGLQKEFPEQDDAGEAQEFYTHVYNILGDPSLQVYTGTPKEFDINVASGDPDGTGMINITVRNDGIFVPNAVMSVLKNGEIISKGLTIEEPGIYLVDIHSLEQGDVLDIYANKSGFIQGHIQFTSPYEPSHLSIKSFSVETAEANDKIVYGETINFSIEIENNSENDIDPDSVIFGVKNCTNVPYNQEIDVPSIPAGESVVVSNIESVIYPYSNQFYFPQVYAAISSQTEGTIGHIVLDVETPVFDISFVNTAVTPNSTLSPSLAIKSYTDVDYNDMLVHISCLNDSSDCDAGANDANASFFVSVSAFEERDFTYPVDITLGDISYGSDVTFLVEFLIDNHPIFRQEVQLHIEPQMENLPVAPSNYGYWAYDDTDLGFDQTPTFDWVELDPSFGGENGTEYLLDDDDHVDIALPFAFQYHGVNFENMTISSNGWTSFEPCYLDYFWNYTIPMFMGPKALLAPFWDDLEVVGENWIRVYTWHDEANGRFVIEWSRVLNGYDETTEETFEIILYTQNAKSTESGDGVIDFQYLEIDDVDATKNYATVGIESPEKNDGIQYAFNHGLASGAAPLANHRVIRFSTEAPDNYVAPLAIDTGLNPNIFHLSPAFPNPFNPTTNINFNLPENAFVSVVIYDIMGREVNTLLSKWMNSGLHHLQWNGINALGTKVASGTYFVVAKKGNQTKIQKILFLK